MKLCGWMDGEGRGEEDALVYYKYHDRGLSVMGYLSSFVGVAY